MLNTMKQLSINTHTSGLNKNNKWPYINSNQVLLPDEFGPSTCTISSLSEIFKFSYRGKIKLIVEQHPNILYK